MSGIIQMDSHPLRQFDLNLLVSLHTLLEYKNVTHAAQAMHLSQPAVSAQLSKLRTLFNDPLLIPSYDGKGMVLTDRATALIIPLKGLIDHLYCINYTEQNFDPRTDECTFKIAVNDNASISIISPLIKFINQLRNNKLKIEFVVCCQDMIKQRLEQNEIDLLIDLEKNVPENFPSRLLIDDDFVLCFGQTHALSKKQNLTVDEYCALEHITVSSNEINFIKYTDQTLYELGYKRHIRHNISHYLLAIECLQNTDYVCLLPRHIAQRAYFDLNFLELPFQTARYRLRMVWHSKNHNNPATVWLRHEISKLICLDQ